MESVAGLNVKQGKMPNALDKFVALANKQAGVVEPNSSTTTKEDSISPMQNAILEAYSNATKNYIDSIKAKSDESLSEEEKAFKNVSAEELAVFLQWRDGKLEITEENKSMVFPALTSIATNGNVVNDSDGSMFMMFQRKTDDDAHKLKEGIIPEKDEQGFTHLKYSKDAIAKAYAEYFDAREAGVAGMNIILDKKLLAKGAGLKEGESFANLSHTRQLEIAHNLAPFYDGKRIKSEIDGVFMTLGDNRKIDCNDTEAGRQLIQYALNGDVESASFIDADAIEDFMESDYPKTEEGLAKFLYEHPMENKYKKIVEESAFKNMPMGATSITLGESATAVDMFNSADWLFGVREGDTYKLQYYAGKNIDREYMLIDKVISGLVDADGRYSAIAAINVLNENPQAWSFVSRFFSTANGDYKPLDADAESRKTLIGSTVLGSNMVTAPFGLALQGKSIARGDFEMFTPLNYDLGGMYDMLVDYIAGAGSDVEEAKKRENDVFAALNAIALLDKRRGNYYSDTGSNVKDAFGRFFTGGINSIDSGAFGFWRGVGSLVEEQFSGVDERVADIVSRHVDADTAEFRQKAKAIRKAVIAAAEPSYFSDDTIAGDITEFVCNIEAMGPIFIGGKAAVGAAEAGLGKAVLSSARAVRAATRMGRFTNSLTSRMAKAGIFMQRSGASALTGGKIMTASQRNAMKAIERIENEQKAMLGKVADKNTTITQANKIIEDYNNLIKTLPVDATNCEKLADGIATLIQNIPAAAYLGVQAKERALGGYIVEGETLDNRILDDYETWAQGKGIIEAVLMAGVIHFARENGSMLLKDGNAPLQIEAKRLQAEYDAILNGIKTPADKDVVKYMLGRILLNKGFAQAKKAFVENASFMFTMEEATALYDNQKKIYDDITRDPYYKPTPYDMLGRGQAEALASTAEMSIGPSAIAAARGTIAEASRGKKALSKEQIDNLVNSRYTNLVKEIGKKETANGAAETVVKNILLEYFKEGSNKEAVRKQIRSELGETAARLFDQLAFEVSRPRTDMNTTIRSNMPLKREQKVTAEGIKESISRMSDGANGKIRVTDVKDGMVRIDISKGANFGGKIFDRDRHILVRPSNMEGLHFVKGEDGSKIYDPNWVKSLIDDHIAGKLGDTTFGTIYDGLTKSQKARIAAGEDVKGALKSAERELTDFGIYIPKDDARFGKAVGGEDVNLFDGVIMLANAKAMAKNPIKLITKIGNMGEGKGSDVETFMHEYFHAITDLLPFSEGEKQKLAELYGTRGGEKVDYKEAMVDDFLEAFRDKDIAVRAAAFERLNNSGVLEMLKRNAEDLLYRIAGKGVVDAYSDKELRKRNTEELPTLEEYIRDMVDSLKIDKSDEEKAKEASAEAGEAEAIKNEILGSSFSVGAKGTKELLDGLRDVVAIDDFGTDKEQFTEINTIAKSIRNGSTDLNRYPFDVAFSKDDILLSKSLVVASLASINDSEHNTDVPSFASKQKRACIDMSILVNRNFFKFNVVKGIVGYDPETCRSFNKIIDGKKVKCYIKFAQESIDYVNDMCRTKQHDDIETFAKHEKCWYGSTEAFLSEMEKTKNKKLKPKKLKELGSGFEAVAWIDEATGTVFKHIGEYEKTTKNDISTAIDRIILFNNIFPESKIKLVGWGNATHEDIDTGGKHESFGAFVSQEYKSGIADVKPSEIVEFMKNKGFKRFSDLENRMDAFVSEDGSIVVRDLNENNVIRDIATGELMVIDALVALNTKQNVLDNVVPDDIMSEGGFKPATYKALWSAGRQKSDILARNEAMRKRKNATEFPRTGRPYVALGSFNEDGSVEINSGIKGFGVNTEIAFNNPFVVECYGKQDGYIEFKTSEGRKINTIENLKKFADVAGYDGIVLRNLLKDGELVNQANTVNGKGLNSIEDCIVDDDGRFTPIVQLANFGDAKANWNVGGRNMLVDAVGMKQAIDIENGALKIVNDAIFDIGYNTSKDGVRKRIDNDEINAFLEKHKSNKITVDFDGQKIELSFAVGGTDNGIRYEYNGTSPRIPYGFAKQIKEGNTVRLADFFKKDPLMFKGKFSGRWTALGNTKVYLIGSKQFKDYVAKTSIAENNRLNSGLEYEHGHLRIRNAKPIFPEYKHPNGFTTKDYVNVNDFGDIVIREIPKTTPETKRFQSDLSAAVVKKIQMLEGWESPVTSSYEYFTDVLARTEDPNSYFSITDQRLRNIVLDVVRERLDSVEFGFNLRGIGSFDREKAIEEIGNAINETILNAFTYFSGEMEAKALGERFGKDVSKLPAYSDIQRSYVNAIIAPRKHSPLRLKNKAYQNSKRIVEFYKTVVMDAVNKTLFARHGDYKDDPRMKLNNEFAVKVRKFIKEEFSRKISGSNKDVKPIDIVQNPDLFAAREYAVGSLKGARAEKIVAVNQRITDEVESGDFQNTKLVKRLEKMVREDFDGDTQEFTRNIASIMGELLKAKSDELHEGTGRTDLYNDAEIKKYLLDDISYVINLIAQEKAHGDMKPKDSTKALYSTGKRASNLTGEEVSKLLAERRNLRQKVARSDAAKIKARSIRNATGITIEEVNKMFGKDVIAELTSMGKLKDENGNTIPFENFDIKSFVNNLATDFALNFRDANPELAKLPASEMLDSPILAAEFGATVATLLKRAAYKLSYDSGRNGMVRQGILNDVAAIRRLLRPNFNNIKDILESDIEQIANLHKLTRVDKIVRSIEKIIDKEAMGRQRVKMEKAIYDRKVAPLVQQYWKAVKDAMHTNIKAKVDKDGNVVQKSVEMKIKELDDKYGFSKGNSFDINPEEIAEGTKTLERQMAQIEFIALNRYGGLKHKDIGEVADAIENVAKDIASHQRKFNEMFVERVKRDEINNKSLVDALADARKQRTGGANLALSRGKKWATNALYFYSPDLFLKMKMMFPKGSEAYNLVEDFRREMSLGHIKMDGIVTKGEQEMFKAVESIYGRKFKDVMHELLAVNPDYAKFSRADWGVKKNADGTTTVGAGVNPNAVRAAEGLSKAQLIYIYAACKNEDMANNNKLFGRDAQYFKELEEAIGQQGIDVANWMVKQFDSLREIISPVCEQLTGMPVLAPTSWYFPLHFTQDAKMPLDGVKRYGLDLFPSFLIKRQGHDAASLNENYDAFHVFIDRLHQSAHYVSFMPITDAVKTTFGNKDVMTAYKNTLGEGAFREMYKQLSTALCGGRHDGADFLTKLRNFSTSTTLFYNIPSAIKQFEGVGAWSLETGNIRWLTNLARLNFGVKKAGEYSTAISEVIGMRSREGFSDATHALHESLDKIEKGGVIRDLLALYKNHGLSLTTLIDSWASRSMAGTFFNERFAENRRLGDSAEVAFRKALADTDYAIQNTQQSARPEFQIGFQRGESGQLGKLASQFAGPAYIRLGIELEAGYRMFVEGRSKGLKSKEFLSASKNFLSKVFSLHILCPAILTALEMAGKCLTHNPDDDEWFEKCVMSYARNVLLGPFSGAWVAGAFLDSAADVVMFEGQNTRLLTLPILSKLYQIINSTKPFANELRYEMEMMDFDAEELISALNEIVRAVSPSIKQAENLIENFD